MNRIIQLLVIVGLWSICIAPVSAETKIYYPSDDVYINRTPDSVAKNYATFPSLRLSGDANKYYTVLLRFPVEKIPFGKVISSAKLKLYYREKIGGEPTLVKGAFIASAINSEWTEETVTWNTRPSKGSIVLSGNDYYVLDSDPGYQKWDITSIAKSWLSNPDTNYGIFIESTANGWSCGFDAKEGQFVPQLVVEYKSVLAPLIQPVINIVPGLDIASATPEPTTTPAPTPAPTPTPSPTPSNRPSPSPTTFPSPTASLRPSPSPVTTSTPSIIDEEPKAQAPKQTMAISWWLVGVLGGIVVTCLIGSMVVIKKLKQRSLHGRRTIGRKRA